ncbi:hypothetical protein B296_00005919 [Ensete ventricosum]|uniref:Uncharacterized protein n=1 Tax=Ensete ventricosum TaxID=4639 RepID=A0A427AQ06_ENSVE|nr:hypothetical protein B296_00005919 [Ensete ventricosum]
MHILGPPWNTGNTNTPSSSSGHRSGLNSLQSSPHTSSLLPMAIRVVHQHPPLLHPRPVRQLLGTSGTGGYSRSDSDIAAWR